MDIITPPPRAFPRHDGFAGSASWRMRYLRRIFIIRLASARRKKARGIFELFPIRGGQELGRQFEKTGNKGGQWCSMAERAMGDELPLARINFPSAR